MQLQIGVLVNSCIFYFYVNTLPLSSLLVGQKKLELI